MSNISDTQQWLVDNAYLLADQFGDDQVVVDNESWQYILIRSIYLPSGWYPSRSKLLIYLPNPANILTTAPNNFYLDPGLRTYAGNIPPHYFEGDGYNDLAGQGFARFSFHIEEGWQPCIPAQCGTTLVEALTWLDQGLADAIREASK